LTHSLQLPPRGDRSRPLPPRARREVLHRPLRIQVAWHRTFARTVARRRTTSLLLALLRRLPPRGVRRRASHRKFRTAACRRFPAQTVAGRRRRALLTSSMLPLCLLRGRRGQTSTNSRPLILRARREVSHRPLRIQVAWHRTFARTVARRRTTSLLLALFRRLPPRGVRRRASHRKFRTAACRRFPAQTVAGRWRRALLTSSMLPLCLLRGRRGQTSTNSRPLILRARREVSHRPLRIQVAWHRTFARTVARRRTISLLLALFRRLPPRGVRRRASHRKFRTAACRRFPAQTVAGRWRDPKILTQLRRRRHLKRWHPQILEAPVWVGEVPACFPCQYPHVRRARTTAAGVTLGSSRPSRRRGYGGGRGRGLGTW